MIDRLLNWYGTRPKWGKVVFVVVCIILLPLIVIAAAGYLVATIPRKGDDVLGGAVDAHDDYVKDRLDELEANDNEGAENRRAGRRKDRRIGPARV